ncbi:extracellular solute-binding protein [Caproicibacter sp.]|uniref:extracellular solute-binding protein n=1 Tax=Caproicibacter sp. TaxID=2814884 RepID=UPI003989D014
MKRIQHAKRAVALVLSAALLVGASACAKTNTQNQSTAPAAVSKSTDPLAKYSQPVVINTGRQTATNPRFPKGDTYENNAYTRFLKQKLNITIKDAFEANGADYDRQVSLAMAGNSLPDMMLVDNHSDLQEMVDNDQIMDLTDVYNQYASDKIKEYYNSYKDVYQGGAFGKCTFDGKIMAMPDVGGDAGSNVAWIRQDWLDQLGIKVDPDGDGCITPDELKNVAKQFLAEDPGKTGKPVGIPVQPTPTDGSNDGGSFTLTGIANAYGAFPKHWVKDANGKVEYGSVQNETKEFLTAMAGWFKEGILDPQTGTRTWNDCQSLLVNGQTGIAFGQWHMPDWCFNLVKEKDPNAEFRCYAIADKNGKVNYMHVAPSEKYLVVRKGYQHPEAVIRVLNLFYDALNGKDASTVMPNINEAMKMDNATKPVNMEILDSELNLNSYKQISAAVKDPSKLKDIDMSEDKMIVGEINEYNKDPKSASVEDWSHDTSRLFGLGLYYKLTEKNLFDWRMPGFTGTTDSMESMWTNLDKQENEATIKIITGAVPPSYFNTFVKNWKSQGGDQITSEIESQNAGN